MTRLYGSRRLWIAASLTLAALISNGEMRRVRAAEASRRPGYEKKESFAATMLANRAALRALRKETGGAAAADATPYSTGPVAGDGPAKRVSVSVKGCRWLRLTSTLEKGGGNCHIWGEAVLIAADGSKTRLSSLEPASISVGWGQLLKNRNWKNEPLKIGDRAFEHGIWVHADSDVCYAIDGRYERFEAWVGMDAARATGVSSFGVAFDTVELPPRLWNQITRDFPLQARWFNEDTNRRPLDWFLETTTTRTDQAAIGRAIGQIASGGERLRQQLDELRKTRAAADDPRWLDLYERARLYAECRRVLDQVWLADLQQVLDGQLRPLAEPSVAPGDPRWQELEARLTKIADALGDGCPTGTASWRSSLEALAKAMPQRLTQHERLAADLEARRDPWQQVIAAAAAGEAPAIERLPGVAEELRAFHHALLASLDGMSEFLAVAAHRDLEREWEIEYATLEADLANRAHFERVKDETWRPESLILAEDRDPADVVLRRTAALSADLSARLAPGKLDSHRRELAALQAAGRAIAPEHREARYVLYADASRLRRQVALSNPLLNFDAILFIKRHRILYNHMCDQYYGMAARPGGGLYVLGDAFGPDPRVRDVLAEATVASGRLKGQKLRGGPTTPPAWSFDGMGNLQGEEHEGGCFLSPELSYDGRSVLFAYCECQGDMRHRHHVDPTQGHWYEGRCYHVFRVGIDGSRLEQLTDGTWNDFDPCWLPNGRIAFISERRGGYLRCGRVCPTYTLFDMAADGSDINCLSYHETNEWHPSVSHDGKIIWTRWDYVDRHGCTAHMPWVTTLDGRDPRALHGNFAPRPVRPDMELDVRAVPGSPKYVATAAPHHSQAYGSLILIDPQVPDDDAMGPVRRITPEVGFPESQGGAEAYGTPWPLAEDYFLCVYDAQMRMPGRAGRKSQGIGGYGIYLVDSFGNRELIYRDPEIACLSPIPATPRPMPLAAPEVAERGPQSNPATRTAARPAEGTVAVINVYDSIKPWPEGTRIKALRVLQVLPMSVPSGKPPHETGLRVALAGDSVVPVRHVLGTVPVEADGSAHFVVPAQRELFFQALDADGLAVQSMRSATHLQAGERLVCAGCHEPKHRVAEPGEPIALALRREPSPLEPDVDGSNPFSYPRLVQPVLDKHCVECHAKNADKTMNLAREPIVRNWYASYNNLVSKYGFTDYGDGYRTTPGEFGAKASKLYALLEKGHYDVELSAEERHRLALWLDCVSMFYGVYEKEGGEAQLRGQLAHPTLE